MPKLLLTPVLVFILSSSGGCLTAETLVPDNLVLDDVYAVQQAPEGASRTYIAIYRENNKGGRRSHIATIPPPYIVASGQPPRLMPSGELRARLKPLSTDSPLRRVPSVVTDSRESKPLKRSDGPYQQQRVVIVDLDDVGRIPHTSKQLVALPSLIRRPGGEVARHFIGRLPVVPLTLAADVVVTPFLVLSMLLG